MADGNITIIKKKKVIAGGGHHGGAWKVAYADFVTAMMAFFLLMWLLNATTEKQRKGLADYFSPTIPLHQMSGGGDGPMSGNTVFADLDLPDNGQSGKDTKSSNDSDSANQEEAQEQGNQAAEGEQFEEIIAQSDEVAEFELLEDMFMASTGESDREDEELQHIRTRVTDEGLVIELFDREGAPLFDGLADAPTPLLMKLLASIGGVASNVRNQIAIKAHAFVPDELGGDDLSWQLSSNRALSAMNVLTNSGMNRERVLRVTGLGRRMPAFKDRSDRRNNRIEIILLR